MDIIEAAKKLHNELTNGDVPMVSVGIVIDKIYIYLKKKYNGTLPKEYDGYPIECKLIGKIKAL